MANDTPVVPKLPSKFGLVDKERVADANGNIWEYNVEKNEFLYKGQVTTLLDVNEDQNGLVTPDVQRTLELIQELIDQGYKFGKFRLKTDVDNPYYFYFNSSDDLIKFKPEGSSILRIEVDEARLYQRLLRNCCIGPKGMAGERGDPGKDGKPAALEVFKTPNKAVNGLIELTTTVNSPTTTPISLRLYNAAKKQMAEFLVDIESGQLTYVLDETVDIEETATIISYDKSTFVLTASIHFLNQDISKWSYKARQKGNVGADGDDGNPFLEIVNELLPDPTLHSTKAIVSLRKSGATNVVYLDKEVFEKVTVSRLSATAGALPPKDIVKAKFVAAEVTVRNSKDIGYFDLEKRLGEATDSIPIPELDLPAWVPQPGCGQRNRWSAFRFNWWDVADAPYMFRIVPTNRPPERCCEQDFFWCPNVGDQPCGIKGAFNRAPNIEMPKKYQDECICECDNPIEFELQSGGYTFDLLDATTEAFKTNTALVGSQDSVIDGSADKFFVDIMINGPVKIEVKIEPKPDVCGGPAKERRDCAFKDGKKIHCHATIQDLSGGITWDSPQVVEGEDFPGTLEFRMRPQSTPNATTRLPDYVTAKARVAIVANTTFINLCRGYRVSVGVFKQVKQ